MGSVTALSGAVAIVVPLLTLWALVLLRSRGRRVAPATTVLVLAGAAGFAGWAAVTGRVDNFVRWLEPADWSVAVLLVPGAVVLAGWARRRIRLRTGETAWLALSLASIAMATLPERRLAPFAGSGPLGALRDCVIGAERYVPASLSDVAEDVAPNMLLYASLGFVLALAGVSRRRTLGAAAVMSAGAELYQALFTHSVCAPRDVLANVAGAVLGALLSGRPSRAEGADQPVGGGAAQDGHERVTEARRS